MFLARGSSIAVKYQLGNPAEYCLFLILRAATANGRSCDQLESICGSVHSRLGLSAAKRHEDTYSATGKVQMDLRP